MVTNGVRFLFLSLVDEKNSRGETNMKNFTVLVLLIAISASGLSAEDLIYAYNAGPRHQAHILNLETGTDTMLDLGDGAVWNAAFHPNGQRIIYSLQDDNGAQVFTANPDGSGPRQLTFDPQYAFHPSYSPDGSKIVYSRLNERQLILMDADGNNARIIADSPAYDSFPVFFQDGRHILFHSRRIESPLGDPGIFIVDIETGEVTHTGHFGTYAYPSPDGKSIVFSGKRTADADRDLFVGDIGNTESAHAITEGGGYDGHPAFTADGARIVFVSRMAQSPDFPHEQESDTDGTNEVFIINRDGTDLRQLTHGGAVAWHPLLRH